LDSRSYHRSRIRNFLFAEAFRPDLHQRRTGYLKSGALVIDVRSASEFSSGHLPNAINLPLGEIESSLPRRVQDKSQVLLLHCHSGMRSGVARKKLIAIGYSNAFNLGSYGRAAQIVKG
jgi:phage shock protein E